MFAVFYGRELQAQFADKGQADDWKDNQVSAYPDDSSFDDERAKWSVHPVRTVWNAFGFDTRIWDTADRTVWSESDGSVQ
jgi:hypothetical protein